MADNKVVLRTIDGMSFQIGQLTGKNTVRMFYRLAKGLFPTAGKLIGGVVDSKTDELLDLDVGKVLAQLGEALPQLFESVSLGDLEEIQEGFFETVFVRGPKGELVPLLEVYDGLFAGKALASFRLLYACIEVNYRDFWQGGGIAAAAAKLRALRSKASPQTSSSVGQSGDSSSNGSETSLPSSA
jgi:hypothetical protein